MVSSHMPCIECLSIYLNVGTICATDTFEDIQAVSFRTALASMCPFCNHRWIAVKACVPFFTRILFEVYKSERCFEHFSFVMDAIDAFSEHISTTVVPVTLPDKPVALEYSGRQGQVRAAIIYQDTKSKRVFVVFCKEHWHKKRRGWTISNGTSRKQNMRTNLDPTT
ncbi:uncharacterized protein TNCV_880411 [Trichonephila clavipes]|nr:uncharacterized protein TNCV_880411 [Trichonephila clavipes]